MADAVEVTPAKRRSLVPLAVRQLQAQNRYDAKRTDNGWTLNGATMGETAAAAREPIVKEGYFIPPPERSIVENKGLKDLICDHLICRRCKRVNTIELSFPSIGVTTIPKLACTKCQWEAEAEVGTSGIRGGEGVRRALVDFDTNIKFGLAFVSSGDGGTEAQRFLSLMSLPNATSFEKSSLPKIERGMTESIQGLADK
jgi:hypothetical protein